MVVSRRHIFAHTTFHRLTMYMKYLCRYKEVFLYTIETPNFSYIHAWNMLAASWSFRPWKGVCTYTDQDQKYFESLIWINKNALNQASVPNEIPNSSDQPPCAPHSLKRLTYLISSIIFLQSIFFFQSDSMNHWFEW